MAIIDKNKSKVLGVRLDPIEFYLLNAIADKLRLSYADVIRMALVHYADRIGLPTLREDIIEALEKEQPIEK